MMREISRQLYFRGMHRLFGNPTLGTLSGFLSVIVLIRASVNLYFVLLISSGDAAMDLRQIGAGWYLYIGLYIILCGSLSAVHVSYALPGGCFWELSAEKTKFKSLFLKQAVFLRPMNIAFLILSVTGSFIFMKSGGSPLILAGGFAAIIVSISCAYLIFKFASRLADRKDDIQILELLSLAIIVNLNPDVMQVRGSVLLLVNGRHLPFESVPVTTAIIFGSAIILIAFLTLFKIASVINKSFKNKRSSAPITGWYWGFFRIKYWLLLYVIIIPAVSLPVISGRIKLQAAIVFMAFTMVSFLLFITSCERSIRQSWRSSLLKKKNIRLCIRPFLIHLALTLLPLAGLFVKI